MARAESGSPAHAHAVRRWWRIGIITAKLDISAPGRFASVVLETALPVTVLAVSGARRLRHEVGRRFRGRMVARIGDQCGLLGPERAWGTDFDLGTSQDAADPLR